MDQMYEVLGPNRYVIHYMLHDGGVSRCGRFLGDQLVAEMLPSETREFVVCSLCAADEARDPFANRRERDR